MRVPFGTGSSLSRSARLRIVLGLNLALVAGLVIVGATAHSLGVIAAGADYLADAAAIGGSLLAISLSRRPEGRPRATTIAALVNAGWLLILCLLVIAGAVSRLSAGVGRVDGLPVLVVSAIAAMAMTIGAITLKSDGDDDPRDEGGSLNVRAVLLDTVADAAAAGGVAIVGAIILVTHRLFWLDPTVALVIAVVIGYHALVLLRTIVRSLRSHTAR